MGEIATVSAWRVLHLAAGGAPRRPQTSTPTAFAAVPDTTRFDTRMGSRMTWPEIRMSDEYRGRWVALDNCRYDAKTAQPVEGTIIDADEDLVELCTRIRQSENKHCAILFCDDVDETPVPSSTRRASYPPTH